MVSYVMALAVVYPTQPSAARDVEYLDVYMKGLGDLGWYL